MKLSDIAKKANVSVSTVSKAFADSKEINEETRKEILSIAKEMGVYDKYYKGKYNRKIIAIIAPELKSQFYYEVISAFNEIFDRHDCTIVVSVTNFDREVQSELIRYYATFGHSDGIIVIGKPRKLPEIKLEVPMIVVYGESEDFDSFATDPSEAVVEAVRHLKANGHRKIGFIGERYTKGKLKLFREAMFKNCIEVREDWILTSEERFEVAGYESMNRLLLQEEQPTAIIAAYDYIALGVYRCIHEHSLRIPEAFSIIGMDDIDVIRNIDPPLTSIGANVKEICEAAAQQMMKKMKNKYDSLEKKVVFKDRLVIRESVRDIKAE